MKISLIPGILLALAFTAHPRVALAGPLERAACEADRKEQLRTLRADEKKWKADLKIKQDLQTGIQNGDSDVDVAHPEFNGLCDCKPSENGCTTAFWTNTMHLSADQIHALGTDPSQGCLRIYQQFSAALQSSVPPSCANAVAGLPGVQPGCGLVRRVILSKNLTREIAVLQRHLGEEAEGRRRQIAQDHHDCIREAGGSLGGLSPLQTGASPPSSGVNAKIMPEENDDDATPALVPAAAIAKPTH